MNRLKAKYWIALVVIFSLISVHFAQMVHAAAENSPLDIFFSYFPLISQQEHFNLEVLPNHSSYLTSWGSLHIVGEVMNDSFRDLSAVKIGVRLLNSYGYLVDTEEAYIYLDNLPAGQKTCFDITFLNPPQGWSTYEFTSLTYSRDGQPLPDLTSYNISSNYNRTNGEYKIDGRVRNNESGWVECVKPVGTLYNSAGKVLGCEYTYISGTHLGPGASSSFSLEYYGRDFRDVESFHIQVDGDSP